MSGYYQPPQPGYGQPMQMEPPEATSIKSMVNIASIFGILMCVLALVGALWEIYSYAVWESAYDYLDYYGYDFYDDSVRMAYLIWAIVLIVFFVVGLLFFMSCKKITQMVDQRQYVQAKSKTLVWSILGILFVFFIPGLLLLIAYLKFDPLINMSSGYGQMPPPPQQRLCLGCGQQIPLQYNVCPHCGRQAQAAQPAQAPPHQQGGMRMCLGCGQQIQANFQVCPHCGKHM